MNGLDNSGKTPPVTAARKTDLWNVKKTRALGRGSTHYVHIQKFFAFPHAIATRVIVIVFGIRFKIANDWRCNSINAVNFRP